MTRPSRHLLFIALLATLAACVVPPADDDPGLSPDDGPIDRDVAADDDAGALAEPTRDDLPWVPPEAPDPTRHDEDGDGVVDAEDPCPHSVPGRTALVPGCSALDLLQMPEAVLATHEDELLGLRDDASAWPEYDTLPRTLDEALRQFGLAGDALRNGRACEGEAWIGRAEALVRSASREARTRADELLREPTRPIESGDHGAYNRPAMFGHYLEQNLGAAADSIVRTLPTLERLCSSARPDAITRGVVVREDSERRFHLDTGAIVALAADFESELSVDIVPGALVWFTGIGLPDSEALAQGVENVEALPLADLFDIDDCQELRFEPIQPAGSEERIRLPLDGYRVLHYHMVERGMKIHSSEADCEGPAGIRRTMRISLTYKKASTGAVSTILLASSFESNSPWGVSFPTDTDPDFMSTLTVTRRYQHCDGSPGSWGPCTAPLDLGTETHKLYIRAPLSYCDVEYDRTALDVDAPGDYEAVEVVDVDLNGTVDPGTPELFIARAWPAPGGVSQHPTVDTIAMNEPFAVYDTIDDICKASISSLSTCGTNRRSGLLFPAVIGVRNSSFFQYACEVPQLARDVVDQCGSGEASFYVLPIHTNPPPFSGVHVSFGNNTNSHVSPWTHCWDVPLSEGTPIHAARRGVVISVVESQTIACPNGGCDANLVQVRHEDDTIGEYLHLRHDGAEVQLHDNVSRGELLGYSGNTGFSTGPHLHWAILQPDAQATVPSSYRVYAKSGAWPLHPTLRECYVPQTDDLLWYTPG